MVIWLAVFGVLLVWSYFTIPRYKAPLPGDFIVRGSSVDSSHKPSMNIEQDGERRDGHLAVKVEEAVFASTVVHVSSFCIICVVHSSLSCPS